MAGFVLTDKARRALSDLLRAKPGNTGAGMSAAAISPDSFPLPFAVRWSAKEGNWVVWLPNLAALVHVDGTAQTITGVTAAQNLPAGWYTVTGAASATTALYLVVTITGGTGASTTVEIATSPGSASTGETVYNLVVATMFVDATSGARSVRQYLASVVTLGGVGGAYWETGGDSTTCNATEIQVGSVLIYEVTV